jgi:hypothetical protein
MTKMMVLLLAALLAACVPTHDLAVPKGPVFGLNAGHWTPAPDDLAPPESAAP